MEGRLWLVKGWSAVLMMLMMDENGWDVDGDDENDDDGDAW